MGTPIKRYRVMWLRFDFTANTVRHEIELAGGLGPVFASGDFSVKVPSFRLFTEQYGASDPRQMLQNLLDIGALPLSVIAHHTQFLEEIRDSFVRKSYYPAFTATCTLGERLINHLVLDFRNGRPAPDYFKQVHSKDSFDEWDPAIRALAEWNILATSAVAPFKELGKLRWRAVHFDPDLQRNAREYALKAYGLLRSIIERQYGTWSGPPWVFANRGIAFIRKAFESHPFVARVYLPQCWYVGPHHKLTMAEGRFVVADDPMVEADDDTDENYMNLLL